MGIKPSGDNPIIVPPDNIQSRWGEWEADLDSAGQVAGEVNLETWSLADSATTWISQNAHKLEGLLEDSAGIGDDQKTINEEMRELLDPENPDSVLWGMYLDVEELQRERDATQDEAIETLRALLDERTRDVWKTIFVERWEEYEDDYLSVVINPDYHHQRIVTALTEKRGNWVGRYSYQSVWRESMSSPDAPAIEGGKVGGTLSRSKIHLAFNAHAAVVHYVVYNGTAMDHDDSTGPITPDRDVWSPISQYRFVAPHTSEYLVHFRVGWDATTFEDSYGIRVLRNGNESSPLLAVGPRVRLGPRFPWENGYRTQTISAQDISLNKDDVLTFEMWAGSTDMNERTARSTELKLSWIAPPTVDDDGGTTTGGIA